MQNQKSYSDLMLQDVRNWAIMVFIIPAIYIFASIFFPSSTDWTIWSNYILIIVCLLFGIIVLSSLIIKLNK